jgi:hypothetical protein
VLCNVAQVDITKEVVTGAGDAELLLQLWDSTGKEKRGALVLTMSAASSSKVCVVVAGQGGGGCVCTEVGRRW